jgi:hypothetical protein
LIANAHARLAVDAEADLHLAFFDAEEGIGLARDGAASEAHASGAHAGIGVAGERLDIRDAVTTGGGGPGRLEDVEATGDTAPPVGLCRRRGEDIVRHQHCAGIDPLGTQPRFGHAEVHDIAAVVAEGEEHARPAIDGFRDAVAVLAGGRGEDVADGRARGEAVSHQAIERGVVAGASPHHHADLALGGRAVGDDAAGAWHAPQIAAVGGGVAADHLFPEL